MSITKLYAGVVGDPLNTSGPQLAASVNQLIDTHVSHLKALPTAANVQTDTVYNVIGFYSGATKGGGRFVWNATASKTLHNGITHCSPESLAAWNGTRADIATLLNWTGSGTGVFIRLLDGYITPEMAGAERGEDNDNTLSITKSIALTANLNLPLDGEGAYYGVSGNLFFETVNNLHIRNLKLKQLSPNDVSRRTLHFLNCNNITLTNIVVNRNGLGTQGGLNSAAGIWLSGGTGHIVEDVEVFGNGKGSGIAIVSTNNSEYNNIYSHDISYDETTATDDLVQGIWCYLNSNCNFNNFVVKDLTGNATSQPVNRYTRGIAFAGNTDCILTNPKVFNVDQGVDVSGSDGNVNCQINGGIVKNCNTWGIKLANSAVRVTVQGVHAESCGLSGFVASGPSSPSLPNKTMDCRFIDCVAINCGNGVVAGSKVGFQVLMSGYDTDFPKGIKFVNCYAVDDQTTKKMAYGFRNEVAYDGVSGKTNEIINCRSVGHIDGVSTGMHSYSCKVYGTSDQAIPNNSATNLNWDAEVFDTTLMHSVSSSTANILPALNGRWKVSFNIVFTSNATGYRQVEVLLSGGAVQGGTFTEQAVNGAETSVSGEVEMIANTSNTIRLTAFQNSGGSLNVNRLKSHFTATLIEAR